MMDDYQLLIMALLADMGFCMERGEICASPQYLELGKTGTINCTFQEQFFAVLWYNSTNAFKDDPLLHYQSSLKLGPGYQSGEFDVFPNGSLIINNVSLQNDHTFRVVYMPSDEDAPSSFDIRIIVKIPANPVIDECNQHRTCIVETKCEGNLTCRVKGIRPSVRLMWKVHGDIDSEVISFTNEELIIEDKGETYDVTFTVTYHITNSSLERTTLDCVDFEGVINLEAKIELLLSRTLPGKTTAGTPSSSTIQSTRNHDDFGNTDVSAALRQVWVALALSMVGSIFLVVSVVYLCFKLRGLKTELNKERGFVYKHQPKDPHPMPYKSLDREADGYADC